MRRHIAIVAVVAVVALAGCSGALVGDDGSGDSSNESAQNGDAPTLESVAYPDGYDKTGITDTQAALDSHNESTADADGFHLSASMRTTVESRDGSRTLELALERTVDNTAGTEYSRLELSQGSSETYRTADGQTYVRISDGSNVQYTTSRPDVSGTVSVANFRAVLDGAALSADSVRTEGDATLITYTADSFESEGQYENVSVELVVDTDGRIHSLSVSYDVPDGADVDAEFAFDYDDVTVERPDWLDEARQRA